MLEWMGVMPYIGPRWNAIKFFESAGDIPIPFLLVDNSPNGDTRAMDIPKNVEVIYHPENWGTSRSWNEAINRGAKWTLITSTSIRFGEGGLTRYIETAEKIATPYGYYSNVSGHCHAIGRAMVERVGLFDINIFPAYQEDTDYGYRIVLSGIPDEMVIPNFTMPGLYLIAAAVAIRSGAVRDTREPERLLYYKNKWGGTIGKETYKHPFNNTDLPIQYWETPEWFAGQERSRWDDYKVMA